MQLNPYHRWLGIRDEEQPPNHYRLLGLELFETDPDVIATAADRQMAHVRRYQNGPHSEMSQRVLNELAVAKLCLLDSERRSAYDQILAHQAAVQTSSSPPTDWGPASAKVEEGRADELESGVASASTSSLPPPLSQRKEQASSNSIVVWGLVAAAIGLVALGIAVWPRLDPTNRLVENRTDSAQRSNDASAEHTPAVEPTRGEGLNGEALTPRTEETPSIPSNLESSDDQIEPPDARSTPKPGSPAGVNPDAAPTTDLPSVVPDSDTTTQAIEMRDASVRDNDEKTVIVSPDGTQTTSPSDEPTGQADPAAADSDNVDNSASAERARSDGDPPPILPVPDRPQIANTRKQFLKKFQHEIDDALESDSDVLSTQLVAKLLTRSRTIDDHAAKYVLLLESTQVAIHSGQSALVDQCVEQISQRFGTEPLTVRVAAAEQAAKTIPRLGRKLMPGAATRFCTSVLPTVRLALQQNDFDAAGQIVSLLESNAKRAKRVAPALATEVDTIRELWESRRTEFEDVERAKAQLAELDPADKNSALAQVELNWKIARYLTFANGDMVSALPYLEQAQHEPLIQIGSAEKKLAQGKTPEGAMMVELARMWSELALNGKQLDSHPFSREDQRTATTRATFWLRRAIPLLVETSRADAEQMLVELRGTSAGGNGGVPGHAVVFDGRQSYAVAPRFAYDGRMPLVIEALVKPIGPTASYATQGTIVSNLNGRRGFSLMAESGFWTFRFATTDEPELYVRLGNRLTQDTWTRLIATYDGGQITIRQDESPPIVDLTTAPHAASAAVLGIGAASSSNNSPTSLFRGEIAKLKIYGDLARKKSLFDLRLSAKKSKQQLPYNLEAY